MLTYLDYLNILNPYRVTVRPHPHIAPEPVLKKLPPFNFKFSIANETSLDQFLSNIDVLIYHSSTVSIQAICHGIPALYLNYGNLMVFDPIFMKIPLKWNISTRQDFLNALGDIESLSEDSYYLQLSEARSFFKNYFAEITISVKNIL